MTEPRRPVWQRTLFTIGLERMAHRPPLPKRWIVYCVLAYIVPIVVLEALPEQFGTIREISWLITLAPAFILSLHYGMLGALAGLIAGTLLYLTVQLVLDLNLVDFDLDVLLPIYVSYGMLAIAVGWLSQQLHESYGRMMRAERLAAVGEVAVTIHHELNNALQAITAEAGVLQAGDASQADKASAQTILDMCRRIQKDLNRLASLSEASSTEYAEGRRMIDIGGAEQPAS